jgi:ELWxxDGT repeat protein
MTSVGPDVFLVGWDDTYGFEPWVVDGTDNLFQLKPIIQGTAHTFLAGFFAYGNKTYFAAVPNECANCPGPFNVWVTDGTSEGTHKLDNQQGVTYQVLGPSGFPFYNSNGVRGLFDQMFGPFNTNLYYVGTNGIDDSARICISDGINTTVVNSNSSILSFMGLGINFDGDLYFTGGNKTTGGELCVSDGTPGGTRILKDLYAGSMSSTPRYFFNLKGRLYFVANSTSYQIDELWVLNSDLHDCTKLMSFPYSGGPGIKSNFVITSNAAFFVANSSSDASTTQVAQIYRVNNP